MHSRITTLVVATLFASAVMSTPSYGRGLLSKKESVAHCDAPLASVRIELPKEATRQQWGELGLESPTAFLKAVIEESNCFTVAAGRARATYIMRPSLSFTEGNMYGSTIGAMAAFIPGVGALGAIGASAAGFQAGKPKVSASLELLEPSTQEVRFFGSETFKTEFMSGDRTTLAQGNQQFRSGDDSYAGTETGRKLSKAYRVALAKLVRGLQVPSAPKQPERTVALSQKPSSVSFEFTVPKPVNLRSSPSTGKDSSVLRTLAQGELLHGVHDPDTGVVLSEHGWTKVSDAQGTEGWVRSDLLLRIQLPPLASN